MGTSYYLYLKSDYEIIRNYFKTRNNNNLFNIGEYDLLSSIRINIGKSSSGWKFCLHIYPNHNINSFKDWHDILKNDEYMIVDEYNNVISLNEMINIITKKPRVYKKEASGRVEMPEYDEIAIREAIVNTIIHRQYTNVGPKLQLIYMIIELLLPLLVQCRQVN